MSGNRFKTMSDIQQQCDDCQFCRNCDPSRGQPQERPRICEHSQRMAFIASNHRCLARTAPPGGRTLAGPQPGYPPAAPSAYNAQMVLAQHPQGYALAPGTPYGNTRVGQYPNPQQGQFAERPQDYTTDSRYTYGNNYPGQFPNPQYGDGSYQPFPNRSYGRDHLYNASDSHVHRGLRATDNATTHVGSNYRTIPRNEHPSVFEDMVTSGNAVTHAGNNYGYDEMESERMARGRAEQSDRYDRQ